MPASQRWWLRRGSAKRADEATSAGHIDATGAADAAALDMRSLVRNGTDSTSRMNLAGSIGAPSKLVGMRPDPMPSLIEFSPAIRSPVVMYLASAEPAGSTSAICAVGSQACSA